VEGAVHSTMRRDLSAAGRQQEKLAIKQTSGRDLINIHGAELPARKASAYPRSTASPAAETCHREMPLCDKASRQLQQPAPCAPITR
jgi:hypothetical protein